MSSCHRLGDEVAVGLLAGPEDFQRVREVIRSGPMARVWRDLTEYLDSPASREVRTHRGGDPVTELAFAAAVTGRLDWAQRAIDGALEYCHKPHWLHHEAGCTPLDGMHMAHHVCLAVDWLWPLLNRDQREALLTGLIAKGIENLTPPPTGVRHEDDRGQLLIARRLDKNDPYCLHPHPASVNNWDLWFAGALFMAAALAERAWFKPDPTWPKLEWGHYDDVGYILDQARIDRWRAIAVERVTTAMQNQVGPDGDYAEGIGYAAYSGMAIITALTALDRSGGIHLFSPQLLKLPAWLRTQFIADTAFGAPNFNDAHLDNQLPVPLLAHLARRTRDPEIQALVLEGLEQKVSSWVHLALLGFDPGLPAHTAPRPAARLFSHTGTTIWRTAQDRSGVFFALQSGAHGGAHQHRDRNNFFLSAYGEHLIVDTGDGRYANPPANPPHDDTRAHNCMLIDGRGQIGSNTQPVHGKILEYTDEPELSAVLAEAGACYEGIDSCRRRVVFVRPDFFVLTDRVTGECSTLTWLLQGYNTDGQAHWSCEDRKAVLSRPKAKVYVFFSEPPAGFATGTGTLDGRPREILRLEVTVPGKAVSVVLVPTRADEPAPQCRHHRDGSLTLGFRGRTHTVAVDAASVKVNARSFRC